MNEKVKHKKNNSPIVLLITTLLASSLYFIFFFQNLKIEVFNKTNYDIDSLNIDNKFYNIKRGKSLVIENCKNISIQAGLPFGFPEAKIKGKIKDTLGSDLCGTGIKKIKNGNYKFDIKMRGDSNSYILYWFEHQ